MKRKSYNSFEAEASAIFMLPVVESLIEWLNAGLSFFYPETCQTCGTARATPKEGFVCAACRAETQWIEPPFCERCGRPFEGAITNAFTCTHCQELEPHFSFARAAVSARDKIRDVIHRYKYQRALWFEPFLAQLLIHAAAPRLAGQRWDWIVPVPLHPSKQREREFNQAERLATRLSAATGIPANKCLVRRVVATRTQTQLSRKERLENVRRAFAMRGRLSLQGERIVLVDDVFTTGATTSSCAGVLRAAGAGEVCVWTVARGI
jgi:ComF family protein